MAKRKVKFVISRKEDGVRKNPLKLHNKAQALSSDNRKCRMKINRIRCTQGTRDEMESVGIDDHKMCCTLL